MNRFYSLLLIACFLITTIPACSGGNAPTSPDTGLTGSIATPQGSDYQSNRILWGYWHISLDPATGTAEIVPIRSAMFGVNVTRFMQPPSSPFHMVSFVIDFSQSDFINGLFVLDVNLDHPFPGLERYRGFDVRGIFMSDADSNLPGDPVLTYAGESASHMLNPDGFTRWWNSTEFPMENIFGFTPGALAPPTTPSAILNPYKYFCDSIESEDGLEEVDIETRGTFSNTGSNTRRYAIQFAMDGGKPVFDFNYAIDASWEDLGPNAISWEVDDFPLSANCHEAWWVELDTSQSDMYYTDPTDSGGNLVADITVHDWQGTDPSGPVSDQVADIYLRSTLFQTNMVNAFPAGAQLIDENGILGTATWRLTVVSDDLNITSVGIFDVWVEVLSANPNTYEPQCDGGDEIPVADGPLASYIMGFAEVGTALPQNAPTVTEINPDFGYLDQNLTDVQILGSDFILQGLDVEFSNGSFSIPVSNITLVSDSEITVDLDLTGAELDLYDVTVQVDNLSGPGTLEGILEDGFEVLELNYYGWPNLGRNPLRNCLTDVNGPQNSSLVYSETCTLATAPEALMVGVDPDDPDDRLVYLGYYSATARDFTAYHASDGSVKWSVTPGSPYTFYRLMAVAPPGVPCPNNEQGTVYVWAYPPAHAAPEKIIALSAVDGSTLWEYTPSTYSWLMLERYGVVNDDGDFIFCHSAGGYWLRCLDHTDGSVKWSVSTGFHQTPDPALSPDGDSLYINANSSNTLRAYNLNTDPPTQKWGLYIGSYCPAEMQSTPIVASDGSIYEIGRTNRVVKISDNGSSGSVVWATNSLTSYQSAWLQLAEGPDGSIYALCPTSYGNCSIFRLDPDDGSTLDQSSTFGADYYSGMAIADDGKIYVGGRSSGVYCFNAGCSQVWYHSVPGCRFTDAALDDDGSLYVADILGGDLYRFQD